MVREFVVAAGVASGRALRRVHTPIMTPEGARALTDFWDPGPTWTPWSFQGHAYRGRLVFPPLVLLDKPMGTVTSRTRDGGSQTVFERLPPGLRDRVQPVGRLDLDTTGLLLFTGDGRLIQWLGHPRRAVPRTYRARLSGSPDPDRLEALRQGVLPLRDGHCPHPSRVERLQGSDLRGDEVWEVTLVEGKYHEVRRIFGATGVRVLALSRLRFGPFSVEACGEAGWYRLTEEEVAGFYAAQGLELPARVIEVEPAPLPSLPPG